MPMVDVPFPTSNAPGLAPGEGGGRLLNGFAYKEGAGFRWRAVPGLKDLGLSAALPAGEFRGMLLVTPLTYLVIGSAAVQIGADLSVIVLAGVVGGTGPVTMERNNNATTPDIVITSNTNNYVLTAPAPGKQVAVQAYPDGVLPYSNSVSFLDGYFLFTTPDSNIWASGLNTTTVFNAAGQASAKAEARPDGLVRGIVYGASFLAMGVSTIEIWQDAGAIPFPLSRQYVIPTGLYGPWAVAGHQDGWTEDLIFVASDRSVRRLVGYVPTRISPVELDRLIEAVADPKTLVAAVYTSGSNAFWSLSAPGWTWEYNVTTGLWHERQSASTGFGRWRATQCLRHPLGWIFGDLSSAKLLTLDDAGLMEVGGPMTWGCDSGPVKQFPARVQVPDVFFDFVMGQAPAGLDPQVLISWSHDGGQTYKTPLARSLGVQGKAAPMNPIRRVGLSSHHGVRFRFRISDPAYTSFAGARMDAAQRRP